MDNAATGRRVLIIDDDEIVCLLTAKVVGKYGPEILVARDGRKALEILKSVSSLDLILLDLFVPFVTGWQLLDAMQANPVTRDVPVIILTGATLSTHERENISHRVVSFVDKEQFNLAEFDKLVAGYLEVT